MASTSRSRTVKLMSRTALTVPRFMTKSVESPVTSRRVAAARAAAAGGVGVVGVVGIGALT